MWTCSNCREEVDDSFDLCWICGTDIDGQPDSSFQDQRDVAKPNENEPVWTNILFTLRDLFFWTTLICILLASIIYLPLEAIFLLIIGIILVNLLGAMTGITVTHLFRFPNDGSLRWKRNRGDKQEVPDSDDQST